MVKKHRNKGLHVITRSGNLFEYERFMGEMFNAVDKGYCQTIGEAVICELLDGVGVVFMGNGAGVLITRDIEPDIFIRDGPKSELLIAVLLLKRIRGLDECVLKACNHIREVLALAALSEFGG